jgi:DNA-binding NarL/FixJ family response regulator
LACLPDFQVVGEASHGQQAIKLVENVIPEIMLVEVDLPGVSGLEVARVTKRSHAQLKIIVLGPSDDSSCVVKAIRAGAAAFLPHNTSWDELRLTLQEVREGKYPINDLMLTLPAVATQVLDAFRQMVADEQTLPIYSPLSPRELEVINLIATGHSNKEIGVFLKISNQTVKNHVSSILRRLAVNDRTQAVVYAIRHGWIQNLQPLDDLTIGAELPLPNASTSSATILPENET